MTPPAGSVLSAAIAPTTVALSGRVARCGPPGFAMRRTSRRRRAFRPSYAARHEFTLRQHAPRHTRMGHIAAPGPARDHPSATLRP